MSDFYYYCNQPMPEYKSEDIPCATPIDKEAADLIKSKQATITSLQAKVKELEAIIRDVLYGEPLDRFGNRDTNGMHRYPDHKYIINRLEEAALKESE